MSGTRRAEEVVIAVVIGVVEARPSAAAAGIETGSARTFKPIDATLVERDFSRGIRQNVTSRCR